MAINKVINKSTKSHRALRNCLNYVLKEHKVENNLIDITGPFMKGEISAEKVYQSFIEEKKLWGKDEKRMYYHSIISFHPEEKITHQQALEFGMEFAEKFFEGYQTLVTLHSDRNHIHIHFVTNSVSFIDGKKYQMSKRDLQRMKDFTNQMCLERGLSVAKKGKHFDGTDIEEGEIISWNKDKYYMLQNKAKDSILFECYVAILTVLDKSCDREMFINNMNKLGWDINWKDTRKNIVFINKDGKRIRDSKLSKTFNIDISKEGILNECEKNSRKQQQYQGGEQEDGREIRKEYSQKICEYKRELDEYERELEFYYTECEEYTRNGKIDNRQAEKDNKSTGRRIEIIETEWKNSRNRRTKKNTRKTNNRDSEIER